MVGEYRKLSVMALGVGFGVYSALCLLLMGWAAWLAGGWGEALVTSVGVYYVGFHASFLGGIVGALWGFVHGFIAGIIVAFFYNLCLKCPCCKKTCDDQKGTCP